MCCSHSGRTSASSGPIPVPYLLPDPLTLPNSRKQRQIPFPSNSVECLLEPFCDSFLGGCPLQRTLGFADNLSSKGPSPVSEIHKWQHSTHVFLIYAPAFQCSITIFILFVGFPPCIVFYGQAFTEPLLSTEL